MSSCAISFSEFVPLSLFLSVKREREGSEFQRVRALYLLERASYKGIEREKERERERKRERERERERDREKERESILQVVATLEVLLTYRKDLEILKVRIWRF